MPFVFLVNKSFVEGLQNMTDLDAIGFLKNYENFVLFIRTIAGSSVECPQIISDHTFFVIPHRLKLQCLNFFILGVGDENSGNAGKGF